MRYGYRRIHVLLRRDGFAVNAKRVHRLYRSMGVMNFDTCTLGATYKIRDVIAPLKLSRCCRRWEEAQTRSAPAICRGAAGVPLHRQVRSSFIWASAARPSNPYGLAKVSMISK